MLKLIRPKQWSKNLLVFAGPIFGARILDTGSLFVALIAFLAMCFLSSATYILNDLIDAKADRNHPQKKDRPIASGAVSTTTALLLALMFSLAAFFLGSYLNHASWILLSTYGVLQVLYNLILKRVAIADVFTISLGFIVRAVLGAAAVSVPISGWLLFCTGALALMLGFAKRRHEFILQGASREASRTSLSDYSLPALDALVIMTATGAAICYGVYTVNSKTAERHPAIIVTSLFVFYGIARYVQLTFSRDEGGEPADLLFKDAHLLLSVALFLFTAVLSMLGWKIPLLER
ncbi:MAG: UbiA prenyltransferase family protein [Fimbriimonadaceae bacterium]